VAMQPRMFNLCRSCARQYDVSHLATGTSVRCECGARFSVEHRPPHSPRALQCSNCGGVLQAGASACAYCSAEITLEERRLDSICPSCFARLASDARFCMECGTAIQTQALIALAEHTRCPRCKAALRSRSLGELALIECSSCGGLWISHETFERLCDRADQQELTRRLLGARPAPTGVVSENAVAYLPCPLCATMMNRRNFAHISGVILDVCREHGLWLDHTELEKVLDFVRAGGLDKSRRREVDQLEERKRRAEQEVVAASLPYEREAFTLDRGGDSILLLDALRHLARWI
jgi:Zn-finger nucleic acid-binding protein